MHPEVLPPATAAKFGTIGAVAREYGFVLVGGTALALYLGHRQSEDLDFFTSDDFVQEPIIEALQELYPDELAIAESGRRNTLHLSVRHVKVSFLRQSGDHLQNTVLFEGVPMASLDALIAMKLNAVTTRGAKKDFIDIYAICQNNAAALGEAIAKACSIFPRLNRIHLLKSLVYFADTEEDPMPILLHPYDWHEIKEFFIHAVPAVLHQEISE